MTHRYPYLLADKAQWFAIHTKFRCEKAVVKLLNRKGITAYAPVQKKARKRSGRIKFVELPLISCYVFVKIVRKQYVQVLETEHVSAFIRMTGEIMPIPDEAMSLMKRIVQDEDLDIQVDYHTIREGDIVTINSGSMTGVSGKVVKQENKRFFEIELDNFGYDILISVDSVFLNKTGLRIDE